MHLRFGVCRLGKNVFQLSVVSGICWLFFLYDLLIIHNRHQCRTNVHLDYFRTVFFPEQKPLPLEQN